MRAVRQRAGTQERQQRGAGQVPVQSVRLPEGYLHPAGPARPARYAQVGKLLVECNSQRSIVRATGMS